MSNLKELKELKKLVKLANNLDSKGLYKEADEIDKFLIQQVRIIKKASLIEYIKNQTLNLLKRIPALNSFLSQGRDIPAEKAVQFKDLLSQITTHSPEAVQKVVDKLIQAAELGNDISPLGIAKEAEEFEEALSRIEEAMAKRRQTREGDTPIVLDRGQTREGDTPIVLDRGQTMAERRQSRRNPMEESRQSRRSKAPNSISFDKFKEIAKEAIQEVIIRDLASQDTGTRIITLLDEELKRSIAEFLARQSKYYHNKFDEESDRLDLIKSQADQALRTYRGILPRVVENYNNILNALSERVIIKYKWAHPNNEDIGGMVNIIDINGKPGVSVTIYAKANILEMANDNGNKEYIKQELKSSIEHEFRHAVDKLLLNLFKGSFLRGDAEALFGGLPGLNYSDLFIRTIQRIISLSNQNLPESSGGGSGQQYLSNPGEFTVRVRKLLTFLNKTSISAQDLKNFSTTQEWVPMDINWFRYLFQDLPEQNYQEIASLMNRLV